MNRKKLIEGPVLDKNLKRQIESIKRKKITEKKVVSLSEFRGLKKEEQVKNILVVDDDEIMRNALKRILENEGFNVQLAMDGMELSKIIDSASLDLILLDVNLPWVDGYEICRIVKEHQTLKNVPLIFVSARKSEEDVKKGFEAGCNDYVTKPFDIDQMTQLVNRTLLQTS